MTSKSELISAAILRHLMSGIEAEKAIDSVLGEGTVKQLVSEIYDVFQERIEEQNKVGNE
jgi:predicted transcriptional regulator YheO